jgi:hypothetical protein
MRNKRTIADGDAKGSNRLQADGSALERMAQMPKTAVIR